MREKCQVLLRASCCGLLARNPRELVGGFEGTELACVRVTFAEHDRRLLIVVDDAPFAVVKYYDELRTAGRTTTAMRQDSHP